MVIIIIYSTKGFGTIYYVLDNDLCNFYFENIWKRLYL